MRPKNTFQKIRRRIHEYVPTNTPMTCADITDQINEYQYDWKKQHGINQVKAVLGGMQHPNLNEVTKNDARPALWTLTNRVYPPVNIEPCPHCGNKYTRKDGKYSTQIGECQSWKCNKCHKHFHTDL